MITRSLVAVTIAIAVALATPASAQTNPQPARGSQPPTPRATPARPAPALAQPDERPQPVAVPPPPRPEGPPQNVRVELTITDQRGGTAPVKKTVTVIAADGLLNRIRSTSQFNPPMGEVPLNVDVTPIVRTGGKIRLQLIVQYDLPAPPAVPAPDGPRAPSLMRTAISETINTYLDDGKAVVVAQSADPVSDRQVTLEVKATILK